MQPYSSSPQLLYVYNVKPILCANSQGMILNVFFLFFYKKRHFEKINIMAHETPTSFMANAIKNFHIFRCASISWIHVGESVSESLIHVFEFLSNLGHIIRLSSGYVQGMFRECSE